LVKKKFPVRWSPKSKQRLDGIYVHIAEDSVSAAKYVKKSLIQLGGRLGHFPEKYSSEEYLAKVPVQDHL
jgi:plasmid stabilization system protein ParE